MHSAAGSVIQGFFPGGRPRLPGGAAGPQPATRSASFIPLPPHLLRPPHTGQSLPASIQRKAESLFRTSLAEVRIHVGPEPTKIGAHAFTHGNHIYFAPGQYDPQSQRGQYLLGHELAHVIQQRSGRIRSPHPGIAIFTDSALEMEADRLGQRLVALPEPGPALAAQAKPAMPLAGAQRLTAPPPPPAGRATAVQRMEVVEKKPKKHPEVIALENRILRLLSMIEGEPVTKPELCTNLAAQEIYSVLTTILSGKVTMSKIVAANAYLSSAESSVRICMLFFKACEMQGAVDLRTFGRLRLVSKLTKVIIDSYVLSALRISKSYTDLITIGRIFDKLGPTTFMGLHGSSSKHGGSLYSGLRPPSSQEKNYAVSQLGPGFYVTEGRTGHEPYALDVAGESVKTHGGKPSLFTVFGTRGMSSVEVPDEDWNDMGKEILNPGLDKHGGFDLMTAPIVRYEKQFRQIKVNPGAFGQIIVMPPMDDGIVSLAELKEWIEEQFGVKKKK